MTFMFVLEYKKKKNSKQGLREYLPYRYFKRYTHYVHFKNNKMIMSAEK